MGKIFGWCLVGAFCLLVSLWGEDASAARADYRDGTWVSYRITASPERMKFLPQASVPQGQPPAEPLTLQCRFTLRRDSAGKQYVVMSSARSDLGIMENLKLSDFPLGKLLSPDLESAAQTTSGTPEEYELPAADGGPGRKIAAVRLQLNGAGVKLDVWKSGEVPFGILKIVCGDLRLELIGCGW